jgi:hypothetical protein
VLPMPPPETEVPSAEAEEKPDLTGLDTDDMW